MNNTPKSLWTTVSAICLVAGGLVIFGCSRDAPPDRPMSGKLRIVSLAPSVTEILFALALGDSLVGATDHCDYPPEAMSIERVGGVRHAQRGKAAGPESRPGDRSRT